MGKELGIVVRHGLEQIYNYFSKYEREHKYKKKVDMRARYQVRVPWTRHNRGNVVSGVRSINMHPFLSCHQFAGQGISLEKM